MGLFASIATAVAPKLIGGLFGRKKQSNIVEYGALVNKARAAGFNPLTALRNGGAAGFTTTRPVLSSGSFLGDALQSGFDAAAAYKQDELDAEREALKTDILKEELKRLQNQNTQFGNSQGFTPPSVVTYTGQHENVSNSSQGLRPKLSGGAGDRIPIGVAPLDALDQAPKDEKTAFTSFGMRMEPNPWFSDSEIAETRQGDIGSVPHQIFTTGMDYVWNAHRLGKRHAAKLRAWRNERQKRKTRPVARPPTRPLWRGSFETSAF